MARKIATREIGEYRFRVKQMKVRKAHRVMTRIAKVIGPSLGAVGDDLDARPAGENGSGSLFGGAISGAVSKFAENLGEEDINWLVDELRPDIERETDVEGSFVPMTADLWDDTFAGALLDEFKLIAFVLEHNYAQFFTELGGIAGVRVRLGIRTPSASKPPSTERTGSGDSP